MAHNKDSYLGNPNLKKTDFDSRIDILPVSDPNIFSMTQRISLAQEQLKMSQAAPQLHNQYEAFHRMYAALGVQNIDMLLPPPQQPKPDSAAMENGRSMTIPNGAPPLKAFPEQDHVAHIESHLAFIKSPLIQASPQVYGVLLAHLFEHVALAAQRAINDQMHDLMAMVPPPPPPHPEMISSQASKIEAAMIEEIMGALKPTDPNESLLDIQKRDLDLRSEALDFKKEEVAHKLDLEERKMEERAKQDNERRNSNEDISQLRANVSMARAHTAAHSKRQ